MFSQSWKNRCGLFYDQVLLSAILGNSFRRSFDVCFSLLLKELQQVDSNQLCRLSEDAVFRLVYPLDFLDLEQWLYIYIVSLSSEDIDFAGAKLAFAISVLTVSLEIMWSFSSRPRLVKGKIIGFSYKCCGLIIWKAKFKYLIMGKMLAPACLILKLCCQIVSSVFLYLACFDHHEPELSCSLFTNLNPNDLIIWLFFYTPF